MAEIGTSRRYGALAHMLTTIRNHCICYRRRRRGKVHQRPDTPLADWM